MTSTTDTGSAPAGSAGSPNTDFDTSQSRTVVPHASSFTNIGRAPFSYKPTDPRARELDRFNIPTVQTHTGCINWAVPLLSPLTTVGHILDPDAKDYNPGELETTYTFTDSQDCRQIATAPNSLYPLWAVPALELPGRIRELPAGSINTAGSEIRLRVGKDGSCWFEDVTAGLVSKIPDA